MSKAALTKTQIRKTIGKIGLMPDPETKLAAFVLTHLGMRISEVARIDVKAANNGVIWAGTMRWNGVILERFCDADDEFIEDDRAENPDINYKYLQDLVNEM